MQPERVDVLEIRKSYANSYPPESYSLDYNLHPQNQAGKQRKNGGRRSEGLKLIGFGEPRWEAFFWSLMR